MELITKAERAAKDILGDRMKEIMFVDMLCVKPERQNLGYGTALMDNVLSAVGSYNFIAGTVY